MPAVENLPVLQFRLSDELMEGCTISNEIPSHCSKYLIKNSEVEYKEGSFGYILTQSISTDRWSAGWININTSIPTDMFLSTENGMIFLYCALKNGTFCNECNNENISIKNGKYGFHHIPSGAKSKLSFLGHHEAFYLSIPLDFLISFMNQRSIFEDLYQSLILNSSKKIEFPSFRLGVDEKKLINAMYNCSFKDEARILYFTGRICDLLICYINSLKIFEAGKFKSTDQKKRLQEVEVYISQNLHLNLKVDSLCRLAGMNIRSFEISFKSLYGYKPKEYIEYQRLKRSEELLAATTQSITDIAHQVGFSTSNYFSFVFQKRNNCQPREYRNRCTAASKDQ